MMQEIIANFSQIRFEKVGAYKSYGPFGIYIELYGQLHVGFQPFVFQENDKGINMDKFNNSFIKLNSKAQVHHSDHLQLFFFVVLKEI